MWKLITTEKPRVYTENKQTNKQVNKVVTWIKVVAIGTYISGNIWDFREMGYHGKTTCLSFTHVIKQRINLVPKRNLLSKKS